MYPGMTTNSSTTFSKTPAWIWKFVGTFFENNIRIIGNQNGIAKGSNAARLPRVFSNFLIHIVFTAPRRPPYPKALVANLTCCNRLAVSFVLGKNLALPAVWQ